MVIIMQTEFFFPHSAVFIQGIVLFMSQSRRYQKWFF